MIHLFEILAQSGWLQFSTICTQSKINTFYKYQYLDIQNHIIREIDFKTRIDKGIQ